MQDFCREKKCAVNLRQSRVSLKMDELCPRKECQRLIYNKIGINFYKVDRLSNNHLLENLTTV